MKRTLKDLAKSILYHTGAFDAVRVFQRNRVIILMYHRFSDKPEPFKISKDVFEKQIRFLQQRYNFISLQHYAEVLEGAREHLPPNPIIVTIDDGYRDNYIVAYPVLKKYQIPATIFLPTQFITYRAWLWQNELEYILKNTNYKRFTLSLNGNPIKFDVGSFHTWHMTQLKIYHYCRSVSDTNRLIFLKELAQELKVTLPEKATDEYAPMTWDQIREMNHGGIEFGSHTRSHPILSRLDSKAIEEEIRGSKTDIEERLGQQVKAFCYPNGSLEDFDDRAVEVLRRSGYTLAVTNVPGHNTSKAEPSFFLKRITITESDQMYLTTRMISP